MNDDNGEAYPEWRTRFDKDLETALKTMRDTLYGIVSRAYDEGSQQGWRQHREGLRRALKDANDEAPSAILLRIARFL